MTDATPFAGAQPAASGNPPRVPTSSYRWQLQPGFGFDDAAEQADYLAALGVSHAYLSPILAACPGSTHGYDVIDQGQLSPAAGGRAGFNRMSSAFHENNLGLIVDIVPNHMAVPTPEYLNAPLWSVLRAGPHSPYAQWFDIDWSVGDRALLMPVLGQRIGQVLDAGQFHIDQLHIDDMQPVLRYFDHVFPLRPGTETLPLAELLDRQWYRLAHWRVADEELNYRRFFDVDTLAAVRVEDPEVFEATHRLLLDLVAAGDIQGFRIDHPDGLANPEQYLAQLRTATKHVWVVAEKILEGSESLPASWACAGTTGYDAMQRLGGVFLDPAGAAPLSALLTEVTEDSDNLKDMVRLAKREVIAAGLYAEVHRLVDLLAEICQRDIRLRDHTRGALLASCTELLISMDRYRAYVMPPSPASESAIEIVTAAALRAQEHLSEHHWDTLAVVRDLVLGVHQDSSDATVAELITRFQQTCGPVMAKGIEDTAFYRSVRLIGLNEVGGNPDHFGVAAEEFHDFFGRQQIEWPHTMTALSTHDTKRSEDLRARLAVLSELPAQWADTVRDVRALARHRNSLLDPQIEYFLWQIIVGSWSPDGPMSLARLQEYATKAIREAKVHTSWTAPDADYEAAVLDFLSGTLNNSAICTRLAEFLNSTDAAWRVNVLGQKLMQLIVPGVPDTYQGCELLALHLVDPDNRHPVDYHARRQLLAALDAGTAANDLNSEKLLLTARTLRLRRDHPQWFVGPQAEYFPMATTSGNALAVGRGAGSVQVIAVATRLSISLASYGGWGEHCVMVPAGTWRDELTGRVLSGGSTKLADLLADLPVSLLRREDA